MNTEVYLVVMASLLCSVVGVLWWLDWVTNKSDPLPPLPKLIGRPLPPEPPAETYAVSPFAPKKYRSSRQPVAPAQRTPSQTGAASTPESVLVGVSSGESLLLLPSINWGKQ